MLDGIMHGKSRARPQVNEGIRITNLYGDEVHLCTVVDLLNVQLRATYEVARDDGGWLERSMYVNYANVEWDTAQREWKGKVS